MKPVLLFWLALLNPFAAIAAIATLHPVADTTISESNEARASGTTADMIVGHLGHGQKSRGLLRFDLSGLPAGATITSASLTINVTRNASATDDPYSVHRLSAAWTELGATYVSSGLAAWDGGTFNSTADATATLGASGPFTFAATPGLLATVRGWHTNAGSNNGWLMKIVDENAIRTARRIATHEDASGTPVLTINYNPPVVPVEVTITNLRVEAGQLKFDFNAVAGHTYNVEYKDQLVPGPWTPLISFGPEEADKTETVSANIEGGKRFFRVVAN